MMIDRRIFLQAAGASISTSLCARYLGREAQAALPTAKYLVPFTDAKTGNKVVKVTNPNRAVPGLGLTWGNVAIHHYSIDQAWNADQSLLILDRGNAKKIFLDGSTYKPVMAWKDPGDIRWHRTQPDLMVYLSNKGIGLWNVRKNTVQVLNALSGYTGANFGENKGNLSDDGTMLAVVAKRSDGKAVAFAYNLVSGKKYPDIDLSSEYEVGWTTISPKGKYIITYTRRTRSEDKRRRVFTLDGKLIQTWSEYERPGHGDFMVDASGDEVAIGRSKSDKYAIIKRRLVDGKVTTITQPCYASHTSARALKYPGWVFASYTPSAGKSGYVPYSNEIGCVSIDGSQKYRSLAQHNSVPNGYLTEPHGSPSPDGKKAIFASNWGVKNGPIAAYVAEFK